MDEVPVDFQARLNALRDAGGQRRDPVRFRYLESLTQRLADSRHAAHRDRLRRAFADVEQRLEKIAEPDHTRRSERAPSPLHSLLEVLQTEPEADAPVDTTDTLAALLHQQQSRLSRFADQRDAEPPRRELKAARGLRATQARLHTEHRINRAFDETPQEAGPLNSHRLVTRALERIREISPAYLKRMAEHMDVLMALERVRK